MGFQLGPGFLRKPPKGWLPAHATSIRHRAFDWPQNSPEGGESTFETSSCLNVTWRVEIAGREPYEVVDVERTAPVWCVRGSIVGGGKRWYKVRVKPTGGLLDDIAIPCHVDPDDPGKLWIDWDRAHTIFEPEWERNARVARGVARSEGMWDYAIDHITNPLAGRPKAEDQALIDAEVAARAAQQSKLELEQRTRAEDIQKELGYAPPPDGESLQPLLDALTRIQHTGNKTRAVVVAHEPTDRTYANIPVTTLTFEIRDQPTPRTVVFEHCFGPRHAKHYKVGREVDVWVDRKNPDAICPGR